MERKAKQTGIYALVKAICNKVTARWTGSNQVLIILCILLLNSCAKESETLRIHFVGDILLSRNVREEYRARNTFPWEKLESLFRSSDLVIGNLEGAVGNSGDAIYPSATSPIFAIDAQDISLLKKAGFHAISVENNHSLDLGLAGKTNTVSKLLENKIKPVSLENSPRFFKLKGHTISVIAVNLVLSRDSSRHQIPFIELSQKLRLAKALSNLVIVSVHWGSELLEWPNNEQRAAAKWLISQGADLIIGHHPHVVQKPELVDGKPVFFSLGNHLFDQKYKSTKEGLIAEIEIKDGKFYCRGLKTQTQKNSFYPEISGQAEDYFKAFEYTQRSFTINGLEIIPENVDVVNKIILKAYDKNRLLWRSHPMSLVTLQKTEIEGQDHLFALESYYSTLDKETNIRPYIYSVNNKGITARWRGSGLAWPILDAQISPTDKHTLCALHRGDAFIAIGNKTGKAKTAAYHWNGFGFNLSEKGCGECEGVF